MWRASGWDLRVCCGVLWCARKDVGEVSKLEVGGDVAA